MYRIYLPFIALCCQPIYIPCYLYSVEKWNKVEFNCVYGLCSILILSWFDQKNFAIIVVQMSTYIFHCNIPRILTNQLKSVELSNKLIQVCHIAWWEKWERPADRRSRARRSLSLFNNILLRTRRALSMYKVYGDSALLVLNGTLLNSVNALLVLSQGYTCMHILWRTM